MADTLKNKNIKSFIQIIIWLLNHNK